MDRQYIDDHHIAARYLADQLSADEREAFETYYLDHPEMVQEMETVACFKAGLAELERLGELDKIIKGGRSRFSSSQIFAAAAAAAVIAFGIAFFIERDAASPLIAPSSSLLQAKDGRPLAVASTHRIFRTRSSDADAEIQQPSTQQAIALEILPEFEGAPYRVSLSRVEGAEEKTLAELGGLAPNSEGFLSIYLDSSALTPGTYELKLISNSAASAPETSEFSLRVLSASH